MVFRILTTTDDDDDDDGFPVGISHQFSLQVGVGVEVVTAQIVSGLLVLSRAVAISDAAGLVRSICIIRAWN